MPVFINPMCPCFIKDGCMSYAWLVIELSMHTLAEQGQDMASHPKAPADHVNTFGRRSASMSAGNLTDLGSYQQQQRAVDNLLGSSMPGLRGVASTSNIWDGQVRAHRSLSEEVADAELGTPSSPLHS